MGEREQWEYYFQIETKFGQMTWNESSQAYWLHLKQSNVYMNTCMLFTSH